MNYGLLWKHIVIAIDDLELFECKITKKLQMMNQ
jgi:hypothetical protein